MAGSSSVGPATGGLYRLFRPDSIAIVGASPRPEHLTGRPVGFLLDRGYRGRIYPVNPRCHQIAGLDCYPRIQDLPEVPDVVLILLKAALVPDALAASAALGAPFAMVFSSGFSEAGEQGADLENQIRELLSVSEMRIVGPNCYGSLNLLDEIPLGLATPFGLEEYPRGSVGLFSQSGAFGYGLLTMAMESAVGFTYVLNSGNSVDLGLCDMMEFFAEDPDTRLVAAYVEQIGDGVRFAHAAQACLSRGKPVVMMKVGHSRVAARAALSHTASLSGSETAFQAAADRIGITTVSDPHEFVDVMSTFDTQLPPRPSGRPHEDVSRVAAITTSGASGIMFADAIADLDLSLPQLEGRTLQELVKALPSYATATNPIDTTGMTLSHPELLERVLRVLGHEPVIGSAVVMVSAAKGESAEHLSDSIKRGAQDFGKPVFVTVIGGETYGAEFTRHMSDSGIPLFRSPQRAAKALAELSKHRRRLEVPVTPWQPDLRGGAAPIPSYLPEEGPCGEVLAKRLLAESGVPVPTGRIAGSADEARSTAMELTGPLVAKAVATGVLHKYRNGLVLVGIHGPDQAGKAFQVLIERRAELDLDDKGGVLFEEHQGAGLEMFLGARYDPLFGSLVGVGVGGALVEVVRDIRWAVVPANRDEAADLIRSTRAYRVLIEETSQPSSDIEALTDTLTDFSRVVFDLGPRLCELEVNPLLVLPRNGGAIALDAVLVLAPLRPAPNVAATPRPDKGSRTSG